jgi:uncharacterized protein (DUF302 family)
MFAYSVDLPVPFPVAVERTIAQLATQGFGILTRIDVHDVLKAKLGVDRSPYVILGACNPQLANTALSADPTVGVLMPCSVAVEAVGVGSRVHMPRMVDLVSAAEPAPAIRELATEVDRRMGVVRAALTA